MSATVLLSDTYDGDISCGLTGSAGSSPRLLGITVKVSVSAVSACEACTCCWAATTLWDLCEMRPRLLDSARDCLSNAFIEGGTSSAEVPSGNSPIAQHGKRENSSAVMSPLPSGSAICKSSSISESERGCRHAQSRSAAVKDARGSGRIGAQAADYSSSSERRAREWQASGTNSRVHQLTSFATSVAVRRAIECHVPDIST